MASQPETRMPDPVPDPSDFLRAHDVCAWLSNNYKIQFQIEGIEMPREQAVKHFKRREALLIVQTMLLDAMERALNTTHGN